MREMKDSGIEWIGKIPCQWTTKPNKIIMSKYKQIISVYKGETILSLTMNGVIVRDLENLKGKRPTSFNGYQKILPGNLLMCLFDIDVTPRCIGLIKNNGLTSPAYSQFIINEGYCVAYYYYYYLMLDNTKELLHLAKNLRHSLTEDQLGSVHVPVPPLTEQQAIADFLDAKCADIDSLTEDIQKQIDILKEYKKSVITQAVTKGLDPNVEMKDSGMEWIGKMPKRWIYPKITYILDIEHEYPIGDGDHGTIKANNYVQEGIPFIRVQNLGFAAPLRLDDVVYITKKQNITIKNSTLKPDDILFVKTGATIGKVGIVPKELLISNTTSHVGKITVNQKIIVPRFLFYALSSTVGYKLLWDIAGQKSTRPELSIEEIKRLHIILPDSLQEQQNIVDYLDAQCADIDAAIAGKQKQLDVLKEYKKSLIYEYVTGKKEVPCREYDPS